jgi:uncharacterized LabA/DUF88 family protein
MTSSGLPWPSDPHLRRWMMFIDGENFTIRAQKVAAAKSVGLIEGGNYMKDVFVWIPGIRGTQVLTGGHLKLQPDAIRSHYYTSVMGDDVKYMDVKEKLRDLGFAPQVFRKKKKEEKAKGVDIALTKDMLTNAFFNNYDVAVLIAGDGDYIPLVEEVKRFGKVIYLAFFKTEGLNLELRLAADFHFDMEPFFTEHWKKVSEVTKADEKGTAKAD